MERSRTEEHLLSFLRFDPDEGDLPEQQTCPRRIGKLSSAHPPFTVFPPCCTTTWPSSKHL